MHRKVDSSRSVVQDARTCLVIGGGLAGLAAAHRAKQRGWGVHVLEAHHELGGRGKSHRFPGHSHLVCELGGEWIGKNHNRMLQLTKKFDLRLVNHQYALSFWDEGSQDQRDISPWAFTAVTGGPENTGLVPFEIQALFHSQAQANCR